LLHLINSMKAFLFLLFFLLCILEIVVSTSCDSNRGTCIDTRTAACTGLLKSGYCVGDSNILCCEPDAVIPDRCYGTGPELLPNSYLFTLQNQGFAGHPGALVYVPSNFELRAFDANAAADAQDQEGKLDVVVWVHGYNNCIANVVRSPRLSCNCTAHTDVRVGYGLIEQFESAAAADHQAKSHNLLVVAEVAYDAASDAPGRWADKGLFKAYLDELLSEHMGPVLGAAGLSSADVGRIRIFSHSGGYYVIGNMATVGGLAGTVRELVLFDSLYANMPQFDAFVTSNLASASFGNAEAQVRFSSMYSAGGGTAANNVAMAARAQSWTSASNQSALMFNDNTLAALADATVQEFPLLFKLLDMTHDQIPQTQFARWLEDAL